MKISSIAPLRFVMTIYYKANNANYAVNTKLTIHRMLTNLRKWQWQDKVYVKAFIG